ncbi:hypothetical protein RvY_12178 [Ramazzottius varieornatus]|uniref:Uncharacterized protein n=1 Tax=Ramazzottius varieornatus TaxID=947166 RepID=A0A1D1VIP3_RAMVA|nr:hypothetical protein RvY_12178 [Ramazzottius varieornatus]
MAFRLVFVATLLTLVAISSTEGRGIPMFGARQRMNDQAQQGEQRPTDWDDVIIPGQPNVNMCPSHMQSDCHYDPCAGMSCESVERSICMTERCNGCRPKFFTVTMGSQMVMTWNDVTYKCDV